jgi:hypothetical protein
MTAPSLGMLSIPPQLVIDRCAQNRYYAAAIESPELLDAIELRARAQRMRAELPPIPAIQIPMTADADLKAWLETGAQTVQLEQSRAAKDDALARLIGAQDSRIAGIAATPDRALTYLNETMKAVMGIARHHVARLDGCAKAAQIVANGDPDVLRAYQDLRRLRYDEYDAIRAAQGWITSVDHREMHYRSRYLHDDDLASDLALANLDELFPAWKQHKPEFSIIATSDQPQPDPRPWPKDPTEQLIWMVVSGAKVWVPTWAQLGELGRRRMDERAHAGGKSRRPNQPNRRTKPQQIRTSELVNREIQTA